MICRAQGALENEMRLKEVSKRGREEAEMQVEHLTNVLEQKECRCQELESMEQQVGYFWRRASSWRAALVEIGSDPRSDGNGRKRTARMRPRKTKRGRNGQAIERVITQGCATA